MEKKLMEFARNYNYYKIVCDNGRSHAEQVLAKKHLEKSAWALMKHRRGYGENVANLRDYAIQSAMYANNGALQPAETQERVDNICASVRQWGII